MMLTLTPKKLYKRMVPIDMPHRIHKIQRPTRMATVSTWSKKRAGTVDAQPDTRRHISRSMGRQLC
eukprot:COSAG02_NODE_5349_length_4409_cov_1.517633_2_plen_66_part_00